MADVFVPGQNCWRVDHADRFSVIIDAADYFRHLRDAMLQAREQVILVGWDVDPRILLDPVNPAPDSPNCLADFIPWLAERRPDLKIHLLIWNMGAIKMLFRGAAMWSLLKWRFHKHVEIKFDSNHPVGATHHQKIVVIDDSIAFCGGIDMTSDRWDTPEHADADPRRIKPNGKPYSPWHDTTGAVSGVAAASLGELARERWQRACGYALPVPRAGAPIWPDDLPPLIRDRQVAISRTVPKQAGIDEAREIEALYVDMIGRARRFIYADNQYFASRRVAEAITERLVEPGGPEVIIVNPISADGWLQEKAMGSARAELMCAVIEADHEDRFHIYTPVTKGGEPIYVHSKLLIIDDCILRVGSSNMNNRSMGLDSECDIAVAGTDSDTPDPAIRQLRETLMAEHLGTTPQLVSAAFDETGSLIATVEALRGRGKTLRPFDPPPLDDTSRAIGASEMLDPESVDERFEPLSNRGLFRGVLRRSTGQFFTHLRKQRQRRRERNRGKWRKRIRHLLHRD
jgi:phosphatidylserine/phosphatidylglycerophosphate/cardiolipin synthase-like enzyme